MKLRLHFLDASGKELSPSHLAVNQNPVVAFQTCLAFVDIVQSRVAQKVFLKIEEEV